MGLPIEVVQEDHAGDDDREAVSAPEVATPEVLKLAAGPQSILDAVRDQVAGRVKNATVILPVGVVAGLSCRYRAISDERRDRIGEQAVARGGEDLQAIGREASAAYLAAACDTLLWNGEPLHEQLDMPDPLRYSREVADMLDLQVGDKPSTIDIVTALHELGESTAPLETAAEKYLEWLTGRRASAVEWALNR